MSGPVLLVHDDIGTIAAVRRVLTRAGHEVVLATSAADALIAFGHHLPSMVVLGPSVESGRGKVILDELAQHPSGSEARVLLLGEEVEGYLYPVVPLPLDGATFLELFESALAAPAYAQPSPAATPSLEDTLFGDLPPEEPEPSSEQRAHAAVELAMEQAHQEFEAEAVADLDASLARAGSEPEWDPFPSATSDEPGLDSLPSPAEDDDELRRLEAEVLEEASRRRQARLVAQAMPSEVVLAAEEEPVLGASEEEAFAESEAPQAPATAAADPDLDFGDLSSEGSTASASPASGAEPVIAPEQSDESEEEQVRSARRAALAQAQREAKEARIRLAELRAERENDGAGIQLESDALLQKKQKEWAEREERIRHYEALRQERLRQAEQEAEVARELAASAAQLTTNDEPELLGDEEAVQEVGAVALSEADDDWGSAEPDPDCADAQATDPALAPGQDSGFATEQSAEPLEEPNSEFAAEQGAEVAAEQESGYAAEQGAEVAAEQEFGYAAEQGAEVAAEQESGYAAEQGAELAAEQGSEYPADEGAEVAAESASEYGTENSAGYAAEQVAEEQGSEYAAEQAAGLTAEQGSEYAAEQGAELTVEQGSEYAAEQAAGLTAEQGSEYAVEQGAELTAAQGSEHAADQGTEPGAEQDLEFGTEQGAEFLADSDSEPGAELAPSVAAVPDPYPSAEPELQEGNQGDLLLTDVFAAAEADANSPQEGSAPNVLAQEAAHQRAAFEINEAIAEEVGADLEPEPAAGRAWAPPEVPAAPADTGGWSLQEDLATAAPVALEDVEPEPDTLGTSSDLLHMQSSAQAAAAAQAQAAEEEVSAAARAELELQRVSARGQVSGAAAARALAMARAAEQEARQAERRQAEAERREREAEEASRRELVEQTRRAVELETQARREREERERLAFELKAQAERDQEERQRIAAELKEQARREREERDRIAAELKAQAERERLERLRLEQAEQERAAREELAQAERDRLAAQLQQRQLAEAQEREEREKEARILAEHARQEREARERLEQQLQEQLKHEREERERAARELEAAQQAARASEERARTALLQVDEEKHGREELELSRRLAEAEAEKARAEAREMAARAEAALVAIPKEKGIIERVARTGIAPLEKLAELIRDLTSARVDVRLELKADDALRVLWLRGGGIAGVLSTAPGETLLDRARQDGLIDPSQLRRMAAYKDRPASDQLATLREQGLLRESEVIPLVQRYTEAVALAAFSEAGSLYRLATEALPADVPLAASTRPVIHLLAEGLRRGADPAAVLASVGGLRAIPVRKRSDLDPERLELSERERRLLESVDGVATLESLLLGAGVRQDAALRLFVVARALGLLELMPASEPTAADPQPELEVQRLTAKLNEIRDADYFTVLGVPRSAGKDEVLRAFELLSTEFHPLRFSTHPDPGVPRRAEELLSVLSEAVAALGDDRLRGQYARNLAD